jgi:PmbA protein
VSDLLDLVHRAADLAQKKGAAGAAAGAYRSREAELRWRAGRVDQVSDATTLSLGLALYVDGRYAYVSTSDLRPDAMERFVDEGVALTRTLAPDRFRALPDPSLYQGRSSADLQIFDPAPEDASGSARRALCQAIDDAARSTPGADAILDVTASMVDVHAESARVHTNGFELTRIGTAFRPAVEVSVKDSDGRRPEDWAAANVRFRADLPSAAALGRQAAERALGARGARKAPSARATVIVENRGARRLVGALLGPLSARALQQKQSFLEGLVGKPIGSKLLTVTDDPLLVRGQGSRLADSNGISARPRAIVEAGVLRSYYVDVYYGKKLGIPPTSADASNLVFAQGKKDLSGLLADVKDGFWVTGFLGGNSNGTTGDFSFGIQGRILRGGHLAEPFAEMNVSGNQKELWTRLVAVGADPYPYDSARTPALVFEGVQVAGL